MIMKLPVIFKTLTELTLAKRTPQEVPVLNFVRHISDAIKEETAVKLRESNFISVMAELRKFLCVHVTLIGNLANQLMSI